MDSWNSPNLVGPLLAVKRPKTPFLNMIGGTSGMKVARSVEFAIGQQETLDAGVQPAISEAAAKTAPAARTYVPGQVTNVVQIFQKSVESTYLRQSDISTIAATTLSVMGESNPIQDPLARQQNLTLMQLAQDLEHTFINGTYVKAGNADTAGKTRGMLEAIVSNIEAAGGLRFEKAVLDALLRTMAGNLANFDNMVLLANAFQVNMISNEYAYAPTDRTVGGWAVKQIMTDFCTIGIQYTPEIPTDTIALVDVSVVAPVALPVPNKGYLFYEPLAKVGAVEKGQIYGQIGLDHGFEYLHGKITNLATS
jgi:hypothetical protein